jgi:hypothetical protein
MTVFITDMGNGTRFYPATKEFFPEDRYPASALIGIKELARPECWWKFKPSPWWIN